VGTDDRFGNMDNENNESRKTVVPKLATKKKRNPDPVEKRDPGF
jgi:hypothetical protein